MDGQPFTKVMFSSYKTCNETVGKMEVGSAFDHRNRMPENLAPACPSRKGVGQN